MSGSKYFDRIAVIVTAVTLVMTILFMNGEALGIEITATTMGYESRLFDNTKVHTIDIVTDDWDDMIENAASEEYYLANVVIDGESYKNVGIRTKGNTSLSTVATLGSERYSFKIEFDHYDNTKSYHGLDKLSLNNLIQDSTMMKDYLTYTMMNEFGVASSLCSYVYITVNGEDWGLYLAVEGVEEAFLERNYGSDYGELYKPDSLSLGGGRGNGGDFDMSEFNFDGAENNIPGDFDPSAIFDGSENGGFGDGGFGDGEFGDGGFGMGSSDVKLQYIDDDLSSYSNIWDNAKTDITEADQTRLIESLKKLSDCQDMESVVDIEQVIRYFVVHNYVCNGDSYTGSMVHNYYLYEKDGKMAMIPWDYNLAFGTFTGGNATETVNTPIDAPVSGGSSDRPMLNWIFENEEYTQLYHQYFSEFLNSVDVEGIIDNAYNLIKEYVEKDPTAFYSYDEFELGVETIRRFCVLRSESISLQLENNETTGNMSYVDASDIILSDMGSMGGGMGGADMPEMPDSNGETMPGMPDSNGGTMPGMQDNNGGTMPGMPDSNEGTMPGMPDSNGGTMPGMSDSNGGSMPGMPDSNEGTMPEMPDSSGGTMPDMTDNNGSFMPGGNMQMPDGNFSADMNGGNVPASGMTAWIWIVVSVAILGVGLIVVKKYKA